jgi:hypothetical protein
LSDDNGVTLCRLTDQECARVSQAKLVQCFLSLDFMPCESGKRRVLGVGTGVACSSTASLGAVQRRDVTKSSRYLVWTHCGSAFAMTPALAARVTPAAECHHAQRIQGHALQATRQPVTQIGSLLGANRGVHNSYLNSCLPSNL